EYAVTPLQLVTAFAAFANGGRLVRPKIVRAVLDSRGREVVDLSQPEVLGQAMPADVARRMIDRALVGVVEEGTGKQGRIPGYRVFGKTGTAQKVDPGGGISHSRYIGTFLTGAPAQDPRAVVLVLVNEPDKSIGYYGGTVAAPAAAAILEKTLTYLGVPRTEPVREGSGARLVQQDVAD
ncbi:MAG: stage V sporulation protein D, partial [Planctomycetes bacterium]|nr:stage V sporulation protein D [Planctomycetota bacterium]